MDVQIPLCVFAVACALLASASGHSVAESSEKYNVTMKAQSSAYQILGYGTNFTFSCSVSGPNGPVENATIKLVIPDDVDGKKLGKVIRTNETNDTAVVFSYPITNYTDDQTIFACQYKQGNQTWSPRQNLTLTVFYPPILIQPTPTMLHADNGTTYNVTLSFIANPPVQNNFTWKLNGKELSNSESVKLWPDTISFTPVLANVTGNYSVNDCNNISCSNFLFSFVAYYAPRFAGDVANVSLLTEVATGSSQKLNCTVVDYSGPSPLSLNLTTKPHLVPHLNYTNTNTSIVVTITNANQNDTAGYVCLACCGKEPKYCSFLEFSTYVGGPPNASAVSISCHPSTSRTEYNISCHVTDRNLAPITMLRFTMPGLGQTTTYNFSTTDHIPIDDTFPTLFTGSLESIFAGNYSLQVEAGNQLSTSASVLVYSEDLYLDGWNNVSITPENSQYQILGKGNVFNFTCSINMANGTVKHPNITLDILGRNNTEKVSNHTVEDGVTFTYQITNFTDDQTVFVCKYTNNSKVWSSPNLTLTVFYGPLFNFSNHTKTYGDNNTNVNVSFWMIANPPVHNHTWTVNGKILSNSSSVTAFPDELDFTPLLANFTGNYSLQVCNNISCSNLIFPLVVYYAPLFTGNVSNTSLLTEIATGQNRSLTCNVVAYAGPNNLTLTLTNKNISPSKYKQTNATSMTLNITDASQSDAMVYTFLACCGNQSQYCSYLNFSTFVGGPPVNSSMRIQSVSVLESTSGKYNLTIVGNFTDNNQAPVTYIKFAINQTRTSRNVSVQAPLKGVAQKVQSSEIIEASQLKGIAYVYVDIYAVNDLGSSWLKVVNASLPLEPSPVPSVTPTPPPVKSDTVVIVVAILVPLAFIVFLIAAAAGGYLYYKRQKHPKGFTRLVPTNDEPNDATDGVYDAT